MSEAEIATTFDDSSWLEQIPTQMNACSIEVLNNYNNNESRSKKEPIKSNDKELIVLPFVIGCYELVDEANQIVKGQLRLYTIKLCHDDQLNQTISCDQNPTEIINIDGGIFDGKFYEYSTIKLSSQFKQRSEDGIMNEHKDFNHWIYAAACSSGKILFYALNVKMNDPDAFYLNYITSTPTLDIDDDNDKSSCLSIAWRKPQESNIDIVSFLNINDSKTVCILSSYANGYVAIHTIQFYSEDKKSDPIISEVVKWNAHNYQFNNIHTPAEVWSCCWIYNNDSINVVTGGDDTKFKGWKLLSSHDEDGALVITPILQFQIDHDAGVTCLTPHPSIESILVSGSYNEGNVILVVKI